MITLTADSKCYGSTSQYMARITGRDPKFTFRREFTGKKDRSTTTAYIDEPGLFEMCDIDKKGRKEQSYWIVVPKPETNTDAERLVALNIGSRNLDGGDSTTVAAQIAKRLDAGEVIADMIEMETRDEEQRYFADADDSGVTGWRTRTVARWHFRLRSKSASKKASATATIDQAVEQCWAILQSFPERETKKILTALKLRATPPMPTKPQPPPADVSVPESEPTPETN
jgi:hypothetical protein